MKTALEVYLEKKKEYNYIPIKRYCPEDLINSELKKVFYLIEEKLIKSIEKSNKPIFYITLPFPLFLKRYYSLGEYLDLLKNKLPTEIPNGFKLERVFSTSFNGMPIINVVILPKDFYDSK